jgi:hypothetical protein
LRAGRRRARCSRARSREKERTDEGWTHDRIVFLLVDGVLEIVAIEPDAVVGTLTGAGEADGPFRAGRCPSCKGTGMACTTNGECCNDFCDRTCKP